VPIDGGKLSRILPSAVISPVTRRATRLASPDAPASQPVVEMAGIEPASEKLDQGLLQA